jgi:mannose-6-phosphate isomerase-like protein (cupin superfamily)
LRLSSEFHPFDRSLNVGSAHLFGQQPPVWLARRPLTAAASRSPAASGRTPARNKPVGSEAVAELIESPVRVEAAGQPPKTIEEYTGRVSTGEQRASVARMRSPAGWAEPGQRPEFDEYTVVLDGAVCVETDSGTVEVAASQAVLVRAGEWVRYSTPEGAEYVSVCLPAFSPDAVHRDA